MKNTQKKFVFLCAVVCGYGINTFAMQQDRAAIARAGWLQDTYNARKAKIERNDSVSDDAKWITDNQNAIIRNGIATASAIDTLLHPAASPAAQPSAIAIKKPLPILPNKKRLPATVLPNAQKPPTKPLPMLPTETMPTPPQISADLLKQIEKLEEIVQQVTTEKNAATTIDQIKAHLTAMLASCINDPINLPRLQALDTQVQQYEIRIAREEQFIKNLMKDLDQAEEQGDFEWMRKHRAVLIEKKPSCQQRIDEYLAAVDLSNAAAAEQQTQKEEARRQQEEQEAQEIRSTEEQFRAEELDHMQQSSSEQEAARILVELYELLTALRNDRDEETYALIQQLPTKNTITELHAELYALAAIPQLNELLGNEIGMLRGHMLYRVWENPTAITAEAAIAAFGQAVEHKDYNAMINLFRDFLHNSDYAEAVIQCVLTAFTQAIEHNDAHAIIDLYRHFLKSSTQENTALILLSDHMKNGKAPAEIWGILALCFVNSKSESKELCTDILRIIAKQRRVSAAAFTEEMATRYEEYCAAIVNGERENVVNLGHQLSPAIIDKAILEGVIISMPNGSGQESHDVNMPDQEKLSAEDQLAIRLALEEENQ